MSGAVRSIGEADRRRETTARFVASLVPRRGELLELAVHRPPRSLHRVDSRSKPSERRDQPRHPHARRPSDRSIHIHFRIRNVNQPLCIHEAPPGVIALEILRSCPCPPSHEERNCHAIMLNRVLYIQFLLVPIRIVQGANLSARKRVRLQRVMRCGATAHPTKIRKLMPRPSLAYCREEFRDRHRGVLGRFPEKDVPGTG